MTPDMNVADFLIPHLKLWKDEGIPAPMNELQSIAAWLSRSSDMTKEELQSVMRSRLILLMNASTYLHKQGMEAEEIAGIYNNRPDLNPNKTEETKSPKTLLQKIGFTAKGKV